MSKVLSSHRYFLALELIQDLLAVTDVDYRQRPEIGRSPDAARTLNGLLSSTACTFYLLLPPSQEPVRTRRGVISARCQLSNSH